MKAYELYSKAAALIKRGMEGNPGVVPVNRRYYRWDADRKMDGACPVGFMLLGSGEGPRSWEQWDEMTASDVKTLICKALGHDPMERDNLDVVKELVNRVIRAVDKDGLRVGQVIAELEAGRLPGSND